VATAAVAPAAAAISWLEATKLLLKSLLEQWLQQQLELQLTCMLAVAANEQLLFEADNEQHLDTLDAQTHMLASLIASSNLVSEGETHSERTVKLRSGHDATAVMAVAGEDSNDDHAGDADGNGNHSAVTMHVADNQCSSSSSRGIHAKLLGLQPLMRLAVPLVQHPTVFMEGCIPQQSCKGCCAHALHSMRDKQQQEGEGQIKASKRQRCNCSCWCREQWSK